MLRFLKTAKWVAIASLFFSQSFAHVTPVPTRVIYHQGDKFTAVNVQNNDPNNAYGLESWVIASDPKNPAQTVKGTIDHDFLISPKFTVVPAKNEQVVLHIIKLPSTDLPKDRESLFYLEFQEAPPKLDLADNSSKKGHLQSGLQIAIHTQIKMMYRPKDIPELKNSEINGKITWKHKGDDIVFDNSSPYVINSLGLTDQIPDQTGQDDSKSTKAKPIVMQKAQILLPFKKTVVKLTPAERDIFNKLLADNKPLYLIYINDYGGEVYFLLKKEGE
ncbi:fimbrial biogenesis chaperone [Cysteiniphilum halobium]|uniref:fimbrial biogenesis chaperone n=1 Tax=Cysteiniphilum halobium TaxID=2219059 RepID=UPI003F831898